MAAGATNLSPLTRMISLNPSPLMFQRARAVADSISSSHGKIAAHIEIAKLDPHHDFSWAKKCASQSASKSVNAYEATRKQIVENANPTFVDSKQFERLFSYAELDVSIQKTLFKMIKTAEVELNLPVTEITADHTADSIDFRLDNSLADMISLNPCPQMIQNAKALADSMTSRFDQVFAHITIAKIDPQHDFSLAKKHAFAVLESDLPFEKKPRSRDLYRMTIAEAEAHFDLPAAKVTADSIDGSLNKELTYLQIIKIEAQTDIEAAKKTRADTIKDQLRIDAANKYIAITLAKSAVPAAKAMAASIGHEFHREEALSAIAKIEAGQS